jgi:hypothetical protein
MKVLCTVCALAQALINSPPGGARQLYGVKLSMVVLIHVSGEACLQRKCSQSRVQLGYNLQRFPCKALTPTRYPYIRVQWSDISSKSGHRSGTNDKADHGQASGDFGVENTLPLGIRPFDMPAPAVK